MDHRLTDYLDASRRWLDEMEAIPLPEWLGGFSIAVFRCTNHQRALQNGWDHWRRRPHPFEEDLRAEYGGN